MITQGDYVQLLSVPQQVVDIPADNEMETQQVFAACVGQVFRVRGIGTNNPYGETDHIELWVLDGRDCDDDEVAHTIWVEPAYLMLVDEGT